jgi:AraC-like DNA-binding protein
VLKAGSDAANLAIRYFRPPGKLERYFQTIFLLETFVPEGATISDFIMPTWGIVSWRDRPAMTLKFREDQAFNFGLSGAAGPFDHAVSIDCGPLRQWSAILSPAGWSRFVDAPARDYANRAVSIEQDDAFAAFRPIGRSLFDGRPDPDAELEIILDCLSGRLHEPAREDEDRIDAILAALMDMQCANVSDLAARAGVGRRTLERVCESAFGLAPKMLLRRQRFMRSVTQHMLADGRPWTEAIDDIYHDQPHFVREFREFTGLTPRAFARLDRSMLKPVLLEGMRHWEQVSEFATEFRSAGQEKSAAAAEIGNWRFSKQTLRTAR